MSDDQLVFTVKFVYPDDVNGGDLIRLNNLKGIDLSEPEKYNFSYQLSGSEIIAPIKVFDDGEFTYFEFRDKNAEVPAFFLVDSEGKEGLINYRVVDKYIVVERVASRFTLRNGADVVCIFNDRMPYRKAKVKKSWWQFWK
jgi:type IV secretion system protein VirB9